MTDRFKQAFWRFQGFDKTFLDDESWIFAKKVSEENENA